MTLTKSTKEAVEKYIDWVINSSNYRAKNIRGLLETGLLKGKPILYYTELNEPSHATALDYLINKYDWSKTTSTTSKPTVFEKTNQNTSYSQEVQDIISASKLMEGEYKVVKVNGLDVVISMKNIPATIKEGSSIFYLRQPSGVIEERYGKRFIIPGYEDIEIYEDQESKLFYEASTSLFIKVIGETDSEAREEIKQKFDEKDIRAILSKRDKINAPTITSSQPAAASVEEGARANINIEKLNSLKLFMINYKESKVLNVDDRVEVYFNKSDSTSVLTIKSIKKINDMFKIELSNNSGKTYTYTVDRLGKSSTIEIEPDNKLLVFEKDLTAFNNASKEFQELKQVKQPFIQGKLPEPTISNLEKYTIARNINGELTDKIEDEGYKLTFDGHPDAIFYLKVHKFENNEPVGWVVENVNTGYVASNIKDTAEQAYKDFMTKVTNAVENIDISNEKNVKVINTASFDIEKLKPSTQPQEGIIKTEELTPKSNELTITPGRYVKYNKNTYIVTKMIDDKTVQLYNPNKEGAAAKLSVKIKTLQSGDNKILPALAKIVFYDKNNTNYIVTEKGNIISLTTNSLQKWDDKHGDRIKILKLAKENEGIALKENDTDETDTFSDSTQLTFKNLDVFTDEDKMRILNNFANKYKLTIEAFEQYINDKLAEGKKDIVIEELKKCNWIF